MLKFSNLTLAITLAFITCVSTLRADTTVFENGFYFIDTPTEFDNVIVGEGATVALLDGVVITGNLKVIDGGFVSANNCLIEGDVKGNGAAIVDLFGVTVGGDVEIKRTGGAAVLGLLPLISIISSDIDGDVKVTNNNVNSITINNNLIGGSLQVRSNRSNSTSVSGNTTNLNRHCRR